MRFKTYICAICGKRNPFGNRRRAAAERKRDFPSVRRRDCVLVCDPCYKSVNPKTHPSQKAAYEEAKTLQFQPTGLDWDKVFTGYWTNEDILDWLEANSIAKPVPQGAKKGHR